MTEREVSKARGIHLGTPQAKSAVAYTSLLRTATQLAVTTGADFSMRPFETLDHVTTSEGRRLTLHHRDGDYFINLDGEELMASREPGSERALAELGCGHLGATARPRVLIGGLGLGYTLSSALDMLPTGATVVVAELFPSVVAWNRTHLLDLHGRALDDHRVRVFEGDVGEVLADSRQQPFDAILLDVDNGPDAWCLESNGRLYDRLGLAHIYRSLKPKGLLAVWSADRDPAFVKQLRKGGFETRTETVLSRADRGSKHTIFLARRR